MSMCLLLLSALTQNVSRTYAQAVAGVAMEMKYDGVTKDFTLQYHTTKVCTSNTTEVRVLAVSNVLGQCMLHALPLTPH